MTQFNNVIFLSWLQVSKRSPQFLPGQHLCYRRFMKYRMCGTEKIHEKPAMYKPPRGLLKVLQVLLLHNPGIQRISKRDDRIKAIAALIRRLDTKWNLNIDSVLFLRAKFDSTGWDTDSVRAIYIYWLCQSCTIRSAKPFNNNLYDVMDLFYCPVVR